MHDSRIYIEFCSLIQINSSCVTILIPFTSSKIYIRFRSIKSRGTILIHYQRLIPPYKS